MSNISKESSGESEIKARVFRYADPNLDSKLTVVKLANTDRMMANVQILSKGGENNMHSHTHLDGFWFVLRGRVTFYGEGDKVIAELGPHEGILIPRRFYYWFESSSSEKLELLQVEAYDMAIKTFAGVLADRNNAAPMKQDINSVRVLEAEGRLWP